MGSITAGALFRAFNDGYHDGGAGKPETLPEGDDRAKEFKEQLHKAYRAGYEYGARARADGSYGPDSGKAWSRYLKGLP